jgi:hypothetical protein
MPLARPGQPVTRRGFARPPISDTIGRGPERARLTEGRVLATTQARPGALAPVGRFR